MGYAELCRSLPVDLLRPCLLRLLEVLFDVLASYHVMAHWHGLAVQKQAQLKEAAAGEGGNRGCCGEVEVQSQR